MFLVIIGWYKKKAYNLEFFLKKITINLLGFFYIIRTRDKNENEKK